MAHLCMLMLRDFVRKRWDIMSPDGELMYIVQEDSFGRAFVRRFIPYGKVFFPITNFVYTEPTTRSTLGGFKRRWTIRDKYVLDLTPDVHGVLDRRLAIAASILLDTGERR